MSFRRRLMMACMINRGVPTTVTSMFTKRTTGNGITVLNNKALLKGIRGNSCIWLQKIALDTTGSIYLVDMTQVERDAEHAKFSIQSTLVTSGYPRFSFYGFSANNVYYIQADVYVETDSTKSPRFDIGLTSNNNSVSGAASTTNRKANEWVRISKRITVGSNRCLMFCVTNGNGWANNGTTHNVIIKNYIAVNLTALFGAGKEPTNAQFRELFGLDYYSYSGGLIVNNSMTNYISKDGNEETLQNVSLNVPTLTGKLNGEGENVVVFPNGMKSTVNPYNSELSYITKNDSGGGYFKIPYVPKGRDIKIKIKFTLTSAISSASYLTIFRAYTGESYEAYRIIRNGASNTNYIFSCGGRASNSRVIDLSLNTVYTIEMTLDTIAINGTSYSLYDDVGSENTGQFELMAGYNMSLYYFQVYKANELVVDCVPYRKDMVGAIKERVSDTIIYPTTGTVDCGTLAEASESAIYDEIKQDENGIWEAYKRVGDTRATNAISGRGEYDSLEQEEIYILDDQTIPTEITVADQGVEEILPINEATPTTAPAIMEIEYRAAPALTSFSLGNPLGGGLQNVIPSDNTIDNIEEIQEIDDVEETQEVNDTTDI